VTPTSPTCGLPVHIDGLVHLDHAAGNNLGVDLVGGKVLLIVAIDRSPASGATHSVIEAMNRLNWSSDKITQDLNVFIDLAGAVAFRIRFIERFGNRHSGAFRASTLSRVLDGSCLCRDIPSGRSRQVEHPNRHQRSSQYREVFRQQLQKVSKVAFSFSLLRRRINNTRPDVGVNGATMPCLMPHRYQLSTTVPVSRMPIPPVRSGSEWQTTTPSGEPIPWWR
jgi:hypothetical protein